MRGERLCLTLASAVILGSILLSFSVLPAAAEVYPDTENIIVRGSSTAYGFQNDDAPPMREYVKGDEPPIIAGDRIGSGAVVAAGIIPACRNGEWNNPDNPSPNLDIFLDKVFQWMNPGAVKVLWYEGHNVYNTVKVDPQCDQLASALGDLGYSVIPKLTESINESLLEEYDVVVIPQLQEGTPGTGGDPSAIDNSEVSALKNYVEDGGGLLIMDGSDFSGYNYYKVQNKILDGLNFNPGGKELRFQSDAVYDKSQNYGDKWETVLKVNTGTGIGAAYQESTGESTLGVYSSCSLAVPGISFTVKPLYEVGEPGTELTYDIEVYSSYPEDLTVHLSSSDNQGWNMSFDTESLGPISTGESKEATLEVSVPKEAEMGVEDQITVTATANPDLEASTSVTGKVAIRIEASGSVYATDQSPDKSQNDSPALRVGRYKQYWQYSYLKFENLSKIPSGENVKEARVCVFCFESYGSSPEVEAVSLDDLWLESGLKWNSRPDPGEVLSSQEVGSGSSTNPIPYCWEITEFVGQEFAGDGTASILLRPAETTENSQSRQFESENCFDWYLRPFIEVVTGEGPGPKPKENLGVTVSVSPGENEGSPDDEVEYSVEVTNTGEVDDTYDLTAMSEKEDWTVSISPESLTLTTDASDTATLSVDVPSTAGDGASSSVTVTATSQADSSVSDSADCTAVAKTGAGGGEGGGIPLVYAGIIIVVVVVVVAAAVFLTRGE